MPQATSSSRAPRLRWPLALALTPYACAPEEDAPREIPPITWSGEHLDYAPQPGAHELCAGTLPYMDRFVGLAASTMGVELDRRLVYVHGTDQEQSFCEYEEALGCAFDDSVYARVAPQEHELVHGVRGLAGFSQLFIEEGTAEVLGDDARLSLRVPANGDLLEGLQAASSETGLPTSWYPRAGHFVAHLQERYGAAVGETLLRQTTPWSSVEETIAVLEAATGRSFEEIRAEYEAEPVCEQAQFRYPLAACEDPTALRARCDGTVALQIEEEVRCDDPETIGPRDGEIWKYVAFEVPEDGEYRFVVHTADEVAGAGVLVKECSRRCDAAVLELPALLLAPAEVHWLRAGRYAVRVTRPVEAEGAVTLVVAGEDCG